MTVCMKFKQGATFDVTTPDPVVILDPEGVAHDLSAVTVSAAVWFPATDDTFDLTAEWIIDGADRYLRLSALPALTATWPIGLAHLDVLFTFSADVQIPTDTVQFHVVRSITGAA